ncbi:MAG: DUF192 domain-containing protein [Salinirussus sp.]
MNRRAVVAAVLIGVMILISGLVIFDGDTSPMPKSPCADVPRPAIDPGSGPRDRIEVWLSAPNGTVVASVEAQIAATPDARRRGLQDVDRLDTGEGMLFVHGSEANWSYSTLGVSIPLDAVFAGSTGEIVSIQHATAGEAAAFSGRGQYILQVPRGYVNATGIAVGDCLAVPAGLRNAA